MDDIMQIVFEIKENLQDADYMRLVEKITEVNPNKETVVEYPCDTRGINPVVTASPQEHIQNLKRKYRLLVDKYNKETFRHLNIIADLSEENIKLRKEISDWEDEDEDSE
jgi:hypothetical protein